MGSPTSVVVPETPSPRCEIAAAAANAQAPPTAKAATKANVADACRARGSGVEPAKTRCRPPTVLRVAVVAFVTDGVVRDQSESARARDALHELHEPARALSARDVDA